MKRKLAFFTIAVFCISCFALLAKEVVDIPLGRNFVVDTNGNIYSDRGMHAIVKFSPKGEELLTIGKPGEGAGDIKRLGWFEIKPNTTELYVTEFFGGNKWISIFSLDGKLIDTWKCDLDWKTLGGLSFIKFDEEGNIYIEAVKSIYRKYKSFSISSKQSTIFKFSATDKKSRAIYTMSADFSAEQSGKGNITIPFFNYLFWTIYKKHIFVRESYSPYILVYDLNGVLQRKITLPFKRELVAKSDIADWVEWMKSNPDVKKWMAAGSFDLDFWIKNLPFPKYKPVSGTRLMCDDDGNLFSKKSAGYIDRLNQWAKIDSKTGKTSLVYFPINRRLLLINGTYFYFKEEDENQEYFVIKMAGNEDRLFRK